MADLNEALSASRDCIASALICCGARYYDASIGRFIQPDTVIPDLYDPQSLNRYSYVRNNPVRNTDPTGHFAPAIALVFANPVFDAVLVGAVVYYAYVGPTYVYGPNAAENRAKLMDACNRIGGSIAAGMDEMSKHPRKNKKPQLRPPADNQPVYVTSQPLGEVVPKTPKIPPCRGKECWAAVGTVVLAYGAQAGEALCYQSQICVHAEEGLDSSEPGAAPATSEVLEQKKSQAPGGGEGNGDGSKSDKDSDSSQSASNTAPDYGGYDPLSWTLSI
ncbi:MAG: RHS repeat-associated core domain-containing protein [Chloroflexi bacterium]|nr:RHS repeat-associated core domain-containing protein [Chloroflexota bacterium]